MHLPVAELVEGTAMVDHCCHSDLYHFLKKLPKNDSSLGIIFNKEPSRSSLSFVRLRNSEPLGFLNGSRRALSLILLTLSAKS
jgi:hypothetical protein